MAEYTYKDVIIDPEDPRVEIGKEYYYCDDPTGCLERAIKDDVTHLAGLENVYPRSIGHFFIDDTYSICIIRKKEPEKKYVPFDLSKAEDRDALRGKWIKSNDPMYFYEYQITNFNRNESGKFIILMDKCHETGETLLNEWSFIDGSPVGKLKEHECEQEK